MFDKPQIFFCKEIVRTLERINYFTTLASSENVISIMFSFSFSKEQGFLIFEFLDEEIKSAYCVRKL